MYVCMYVTSNQSQGPESNIVIGLFFRFCLRLRQCIFHLIVSDGVISKISVLLPIFTRSYRSTLLNYDSDYDSVASENQPLETSSHLFGLSSGVKWLTFWATLSEPKRYFPKFQNLLSSCVKFVPILVD